MTPHICIDFLAKSAKGWIQGMAIIGQQVSAFQKKLLTSAVI